MEKEEIATHLKEHILAKMDQGERFYTPEGPVSAPAVQKEVKTTPKPLPKQPLAPQKRPPILPKKPTVQYDDLSDMKALLQKVAPSKRVQDPTTPVVFITDDTRPQVIAFLKKVGEATRPLFGDFSILSLEKAASLASSALKLMVAPTPLCSKLPQNAPLLKTEPFAAYLAHPEKKRQLWQALQAAAK